jgi:Spy/CpxP family protein refolding chaperone
MKSLKAITLVAALAAFAMWQMLFTGGIIRAETNEASPKAAAPSPGQRPGPMLEHLLPPRAIDSLNLTADQKTKYADLEAGFRKEAQAWRKQHPANPEEFRKARETGDSETLKKLAENRKQLMDLRKSYVDKFRASLTDEQKKTLDERLPEARMRRGPGPREGKPAGPTPAPPAAGD